MEKPVIIDYPPERTLLKKEFGKIAATPGFSESVAMAKEVLRGPGGKRRKGQNARKSHRKRKTRRHG